MVDALLHTHLLNYSANCFFGSIRVICWIFREQLHNSHFSIGTPCPYISKGATSVDSKLKHPICCSVHGWLDLRITRIRRSKQMFLARVLQPGSATVQVGKTDGFTPAKQKDCKTLRRPNEFESKQAYHVMCKLSVISLVRILR